jgi:hypothetical protein
MMGQKQRVSISLTDILSMFCMLESHESFWWRGIGGSALKTALADVKYLCNSVNY